MLTSQTRPQQWKISLPDLSSRLRALPVVEILPPDDALLRSVLVKLFLDRQITPEEATISFMLTRMPRSLEAARTLVAEIDRRAWEEKADVTRPFVARISAISMRQGFSVTAGWPLTLWFHHSVITAEYRII